MVMPETDGCDHEDLRCIVASEVSFAPDLEEGICYFSDFDLNESDIRSVTLYCVTCNAEAELNDSQWEIS